MGGGEGDQETSAPTAPSGEAGAGAGGIATSTIHIRCTNSSKYTLEVDLELTVGVFKTMVAEKCNIPADQQRLIYKGRILKDESTLKSYGLQTDHTIHLVRGSPSTTADSAAATNSSSRNNAPSQPVQGVPSNNNGGYAGANLGSLLFPGLSGNGPSGNGLGGNAFSGLFGTGFPELQQVQQQISQNPNMIREMLNMPAIQNLMNNPDLMRNLIMNNPQMRELIDRNPDLAHILNDPGTLRQTLDAARNPELMREMMRNTDRAMSNIESSPEGFNMLRRMYETVQEPFLNATTIGSDTGNDTGSNPFGALFGQGQNRAQATNPATTPDGNVPPAPNTNPLPNPWNPSSNTPGAGGQPGQANAASRGTRQSGIGAVPNLSDFAGLGAGAGLFDPSMLQQMLQNPAVIQMMQGLLSNPQYMSQFRPLLENMQLREMMQNPEFLRQLTTQENMQQLLSLQQNLLSQLGRQQGGQVQGQTGIGGNNLGLDTLLGMIGGLGSLDDQNISNVPPEELYATQLAQLQEMGFHDAQENIRALTATGGNVHAAVERLLGNLG